MPRIGHDLALERAKMQDKVRDEGNRRLEAVARPYRDNEQKTWDQQFQEAQAFLNDPTTELDMLPDLAQVRGKDLAVFAQEVVALGRQFRKSSAAILSAQERIIRMDPVPEDFTSDHYWQQEAS